MASVYRIRMHLMLIGDVALLSLTIVSLKTIAIQFNFNSDQLHAPLAVPIAYLSKQSCFANMYVSQG